MNSSLVPQKGITGTTLKIIAIVAMLIDHLAAGIIIPYYSFIQDSLSSGILVPDSVIAISNILVSLYPIMRSIGRIAFPIFAFLLVEGFIHTKNIKKYVLNLGLFTLISEIPFDLNFSNTFLSFQYQNVFLTLFVAVNLLIVIKEVELRYNTNKPLSWILILTITGISCIIVEFLNTDYASIGIITVVALYLCRNNKLQPTLGLIALMLSSLPSGFQFIMFELPAIFSLIPIYMYNHQRGRNIKYFFYLFYPVHLFIIHLIAQALIKSF